MSAATAVATKPSVTLQRRYAAPPAKVYAAWTKPDMIVGWFGPTDTQQETVRAEMDVRTGGRFTIGFTHASGEYSRVSGVYKEVVPNEKLVFSWAWYTTPERESQVTVLTKADGDGTLLTLTHEHFVDQAAADGHKRGWAGTLEKLAAVLEAEVAR
jgi:uncharacterized protein YndB with AHSA1/START domain